MNRFFAPAIAISAGIIVLLGYFLPNNEAIFGARTAIVQVAVILAGVAVIVGVFNLLIVHIGKILKKEKGRAYSLILVVSLFFTLILGIVPRIRETVMPYVFSAVIIPVESSLLAIMAVTLIYAGIRLLRHQHDLMAFVFLGTALLVMLGSAPLPFFTIPYIDDPVRIFIVNVLSTSGARGILLGVALGTLLTGLRVLMGTDRPYGGK